MKIKSILCLFLTFTLAGCASVPTQSLEENSKIIIIPAMSNKMFLERYVPEPNAIIYMGGSVSVSSHFVLIHSEKKQMTNYNVNDAMANIAKNTLIINGYKNISIVNQAPSYLTNLPYNRIRKDQLDYYAAAELKKHKADIALVITNFYGRIAQIGNNKILNFKLKPQSQYLTSCQLRIYGKNGNRIRRDRYRQLAGPKIKKWFRQMEPEEINAHVDYYTQWLKKTNARSFGKAILFAFGLSSDNDF